MPSVWFQGGIQRVVSQANYISPSLATLRASLVAGNSVVTNKNWITLSEFLAQNSLITDNAGNTDVLVTGANITSAWNPNAASGNNVDRWEFGINGTLSFGVVNNGTQGAGVVFYTEADSASPTTARLLGVQDLPFTGQGGTVNWGGGGLNVIAYWQPRVQATVAFQGTVDRIISQIDPWSTSSWTVGHGLISSTNGYTPTGNELTMASLNSPTVGYVTNGDPTSGVASGAIIPMTGFQRLSAWNVIAPDAWNYVREAESSGGVEVRFPQSGGAGGNLTPGETVAGVISFIYDGTFNINTAYPLNWDTNPAKLIVAGQDLIYGNTSATGGRVVTSYVQAV